MEASKICQNGGLTINWGKVGSFWRHSSYFKKHAYQLCNKKGKLDSGFGSESLQDETGNQRFAVFVGKCFHLHDCFSNWSVVCGLQCQDFWVLHFVWKLENHENWKHENQITVLYFFLQMTFSRKCQCITFCEFHRNLLNSWKWAS